MNILASEWIKIRSVRSTWVLAASTVIVTVVVSLLGISGLVSDWVIELPADWDPTGISFKGILVGQILAAMLGVQAIASEYATGMITTTLTIAPKRWALLAAKAGVTVLIALATSVVAVATSFVASQAVLGAAGLPTALLNDPDVLRAVACAVLYLVLSAVLGLAFGTITRSSSGALSIIVVIALLIPALAPGFPGVIGDLAGSYWPTTAGQAAYTVTSNIPVLPLVGIALMTLFTLYAFVAAQFVLRLRDA
jgi:ABC-type transport system involved in multi-copper enzyme maturation permease subunit